MFYFFRIGEALVWTILEIGLTLAYLPNYTKAKISAARIFSLLKRKSGLVDNGEMSLVKSFSKCCDFPNDKAPMQCCDTFAVDRTHAKARCCLIMSTSRTRREEI